MSKQMFWTGLMMIGFEVLAILGVLFVTTVKMPSISIGNTEIIAFVFFSLLLAFNITAITFMIKGSNK